MIDLSNKTVYVVRSNSPGYMPDSLTFCATKASARDAMQWHKDIALDSGDKVYGSKRDGQYHIFPADCSEYHTGTLVTIDSVNASIYLANLKDQSFESFDDLIQYLNDHYSS